MNHKDLPWKTPDLKDYITRVLDKCDKDVIIDLISDIYKKTDEESIELFLNNAESKQAYKKLLISMDRF